jgi:hypothetical protein
VKNIDPANAIAATTPLQVGHVGRKSMQDGGENRRPTKVVVEGKGAVFTVPSFNLAPCFYNLKRSDNQFY